MRKVKLNPIGMSVVVACVLSLGLMSPGSVVAGQDRVDVCHSEGNGSYHLITIAEPAYPTHVAHGDAGVGEPVPGADGYIFDEDCTLEAAVVCRCEGLVAGEVSYADSFVATACSDVPGVELVLVNAVGDYLSVEFGAGVGGLDTCVLSDVSTQTRELPLFGGAEESAACVAVLLEIAANNGVTCQ